MPHENKLFDAFNNFFELRGDITDTRGHKLLSRPRRDKISLTSYVRRTGTILRALRDDVLSKLTDVSEKAWSPSITDADIEAHLHKNWDG